MKNVTANSLFLHAALFCIITVNNTTFGMQPELKITINNQSGSCVTIGYPIKDYCCERYYAYHNYETLADGKQMSISCPKLEKEYAPLFVLYKQSLKSSSLEHKLNPTTNCIVDIFQYEPGHIIHSVRQD